MTAGTVRDAVGEILDVWLAGLGSCLDDLLERRVRTDLRRLNDEDTVLVNGGPTTSSPSPFLGGDGLAGGDHRLRQQRSPVDDDAVAGSVRRDGPSCGRPR